LFGDRWTLVIVRDLLTGKSRYGELAESPEHIPSNILAARLKAMETDGLIEREQYQDRPARFAYRLTDRGTTLLPVLQALCRWANAELPETWRAPDAFMRARPRSRMVRGRRRRPSA
jgi:DNA-binding HxlR family transcriptional regulator